MDRFMRGFRGPRSLEVPNQTQEEPHMQNVKFEMNGTNLVITIDTKARFGKSKSLKSEIVASTRGIVPIAGLKIGINAFVEAASA